MSDTVVLKAETREQAGTKIAIRLREQGKLPVIIYGHKQDPVSASVIAHDFVKTLHHGHRIIDLDIAGKKETILVKDLQYDYLGKSVIHADLMRVNLSERVKVGVAVELRGTAQGTHEGGLIEEILSQIEVECKVSEIPENLPVDIKELAIGGSIHASQIQLPDGFKLITDPDAVVVICQEPKVVVEETPEEVEGAEDAATEPEVITEKKQEESE
ncbi:MAG: 50S ribosomal protein L25 [Planctomycetes bacterium]|nr:50S ribosomal protein L25 [Planctomycetota bacterium]